MILWEALSPRNTFFQTGLSHGNEQFGGRVSSFGSLKTDNIHSMERRHAKSKVVLHLHGKTLLGVRRSPIDRELESLVNF